MLQQFRNTVSLTRKSSASARLPNCDRARLVAARDRLDKEVRESPKGKHR
ncbi:hypothetical protein J1G44_14270 [Cellulomonas sp. zg-ZUI199]|uniref:Uncharacterized protein n=1 Tax=Cellulomonas wangleii TaxID=2816956 RepID=A0ABX8D092_9CELL|nr:hypothetical protein [Cellulomonas wangleii]MBO0925641.1 hypothetical protein [Cellulomonas wangleii]QVI60908.1 hypothetical protein KG103_10155 [Cellulomonas wangleii]